MQDIPRDIETADATVEPAMPEPVAPGLPVTPDLPVTQDLAEAVRRLARVSVLVVGDAMLDRYVYGAVERISPEAPVPVMSVRREVAVPGGAGNVVRNLGALGAAVAFVSVVGDDQAGSELTGLIGGQPGVEPWLIVQGGRATTLKTRFIALGQQLLRTDHEDAEPIHPKLAERLLRIARDAVAATSVTLLSDYHKGVFDGDLPRELIAAARQLNRPVVVGIIRADFSRFAGADVLIMAWRTLARHARVTTETDQTVADTARTLQAAHNFGAVVIVRTGFSLSMVSGQGADATELHLRNQAAEVFDISGAGDTVTAVLGAALAAGLDLPTAVRLANAAGSVAVSRIGTAVVREADLLAALEPPDPARKIVSPAVAAERVEQWRRAGWRAGFTHGAFAVMDPDERRLLELARGACDRLVVALDPNPDGGFGPSEAMRAARLAALPSVDLVVGAAPTADLLRALRPELVVNPAPTATLARPLGVDVAREWGGRVLVADDIA